MNNQRINNRKRIHKLRRKYKNIVQDLHNKTIALLIRNYDIILYPDFCIKGMVSKTRLPKMVKRLLYTFSFHVFKTKLMWKAKQAGKTLLFVNEAYTSKTCGCCGELNDVGSSEVYTCGKCGYVVDRDANGARNIFLRAIIDGYDFHA